MGIYCHGNKGHSHSHAGCFPFLPIHNFVINSHSHGIPIPIGNPIPMVISVYMVVRRAITTWFI